MLKQPKGLGVEMSSNLELEDSPFSSPLGLEIRSYELSVASTLLKPIELHCCARARDEVAALVCLPSFVPEWAVWIAGKRENGFSVLLSEAEDSI
jgi:hypothetical protein